MANRLNFPPTFIEFIKQYEYLAESDELVINSEKVLDAWEHYTSNININLNNIYSCLNMITNNLYDIEETIE